MRADAAGEPNEDDRAVMLQDADEASRAWLCPRVGCKPDPSALDAEHREAIGAVHRLTGHRFASCPLARAWEPWVHRVVEADEQGLADDRAAYGPPPRTLIDALRVLRKSKRARDTEELRVAREKASK